MKDKIFEEFIKYEKDKLLFDIEYNTFKIWEILRTFIYLEIHQSYNKLQPLFPFGNQKSIKKISFSIIKNSLKLFFVKEKDLIFLNNPRRVKQKDGKYYCIYTDLIIDSVKKKFSCVTFEDPYWALSPSSNMSHFEPIKTDDICFLDIMEYLFKIKKIFFKNFKKKEYIELHSLIMRIKEDIEDHFKCDLSKIFLFVEEKLLYMILLEKNYKRIINRLNPKAILEFYDIFPSKLIVNKIAKEKNIPIIEIQHGVVTEKNPIFLKYLDIKRNYDCVPEYVLSYGEKLLNKNYMPIKKENIFYTGSLFLETKKKEYKNLKIDKKYILFVSQSNLGEYISKFASELAEILKNENDYQIIYKMHPYEIGRIYECLNKENITIIDNREKDLYFYQAISVAQVGIYSTGLYEGLVFNLETFIINNDFGTSEIKNILKESNGIHYVNTPSEIYKFLISKKKNSNLDNYWHKADKNKITDCIIEIINSRK